MKNYGTTVNSTVKTADSGDVYPVAIATDIQGGLHEVSTLEGRDAIPLERRLEGMMTYVIANGLTYQLQGGISNDFWVQVDFGGGPSLEFEFNSVPYPEVTVMDIVGNGVEVSYTAGTKKFTIIVPGMNTWRGNWAASILYHLNDLVHYEGNVYIATTEHTSEETGPLDNLDKWDTFASRGSVGINWRGTWESGGTYVAYDAVSYNGNTYICILGNTSIVPTNETYWDLLVTKGDQGIQGEQGETGPAGIDLLTYLGTWSSSVSYSVNHFVSYEGQLYYCNTDNLGENVPGVSPFWDLMVAKGDKGDVPSHEWDGTQLRLQNPDGSWGSYTDLQGTKGMVYKGAWSSGTVYSLDDVVYYAGSSYIYKYGTPGATTAPPLNTSRWDKIVDKGDIGVTYIGVWSGGVTYYQGNAVLYNGSVYIYTNAVGGTTSNPLLDARFSLLISGIYYRGDFEATAGTVYYPYQMVNYYGRTYILSSLSSVTITESRNCHPDLDTTHWSLMSPRTVVYQGDWSRGSFYVFNDVVNFVNCKYRYNSQTPGNVYNIEETDYNPGDDPQHKFELYSWNYNFLGGWEEDTEYFYGDVVMYNSGSAYVCKAQGGVVSALPTNETYYTKIVSQGDQGIQGPPGLDLFASYDSYDPLLTYPPVTLVRYNGRQWLSKIETIGVEPAEGDNWSLFTDIGPIGPAGPTGSKGANWRGAWSGPTEYFVNDVVSYSGNTYISILGGINKIPSLETTYWQLFVSKGDKGAELSWKGAWSDVVSYIENDAVSYVGNIYIALRSNIDVTPGASGSESDWDVFVTKGDTGEKGDVGLTGAKGDPGIPGINLIPFGAWDEEVVYEPGSLVTDNGSAWECIASNVGVEPSEAQSSYWRIFVSKGDLGLQWKGTYSPSTTYVERDVVYCEGTAYVCIFNGTLNRIPTYSGYIGLYWDVFIAAVQGEQGEQGLRGYAGSNLVYMENWDPTESYPSGILVTYQGNAYYSLEASYGYNPVDYPDYWLLFVAKGDQGIQGIEGPIGPEGDQGIPGVGLTYEGIWASGSTYSIDSLVYYNNALWHSLAETTGSLPQVSSEYWDLFLDSVQGEKGDQGDKGDSGIGLTYAGIWSSGSAYSVDSLVYHNYALWNSLQESIGEEPDEVDSEYWELFLNTLQGAKGDQGDKGDSGDVGPRGYSGAVLNFAGTWLSTEPYVVNDLVAYEGSTWICILENSNIIPREGLYWTSFVKRGPMGPQGYIGPKGDRGDPGSLFTFCGSWNNYTTYAADSLVEHEGSAYVSLQSSINKIPYVEIAYWTMIVSKGATGSIGPQGIQGPIGLSVTGPAGPRGERGLPGAGLNPLGAWNGSTIYGKWSLVVYSGSSYYALSDNQNVLPAGNPSVWQLFAAKGDQGIQGIQGPVGSEGAEGPIGPQGEQGVPGIIWKGAWSSSTSYGEGDTVFYEGDSWVCILANDNHAPEESSTYWEYLSKKAEYNFIEGSGIGVLTEGMNVTISNTLDSAEEIIYENTDHPAFENIKDALDYLLYVPISVNTYTGGTTVEIGSTVTAVTLDWTLNKTPVSQTLNSETLSVSDRTKEYTGLSLTEDTTYTLVVDDGTSTDTEYEYVLFRHKRYWGVSELTSLTDGQIIALSSELHTSRVQSRTFDCTGGKYFYFAYPASWGTATFKVGGLSFSDVTLVTRDFVNASGNTTSFNIYRCNNLQTGSSILVEVS